MIEKLFVSYLFSTFFFLLQPCLGQSRRVLFKSNPFVIREVDLAKEELRLMWRDSQGNRLRNANGLSRWGGQRKLDLIFATNAGIFERGYTPTGLLVIGGKVITPLNTASGSGNFFLQPNGVFSVTDGVARIDATSALSGRSTFDIATQSGPLLLLGGKYHPAFRKNSRNKRVRSGVGVRSETEVVFAISNKPVSFYDFASLFKESLGCEDALYLDGVISFMYAKDRSRLQQGGDYAGMFAIFRSLEE